MFDYTKRVIDLGLVCSDFDAALHFYHELLGLEIALDIDIPESVAVGACLAPSKFRQVRLQAGETLIKLMEIESPPEAKTYDFQSGVRWLTFIIEDVPGVVERLRANGVEFFAEPVSAPDAKHVVCAKGPDGILIELVELRDEDKAAFRES